jgi:predicted secreted protein
MNWITGIVVYLCLWWVVIFAVLPWGVQPTGENASGLEPGAPRNPHLLLKALVTTGVSAVLWFAVYGLVMSDFFNPRAP